MITLQYTFSIALLSLGGLLAIVNARVLVKQLQGKHGSSAAPFIGGIFLFIGGLSYPDGLLRSWAWIGLFADYGCIPYITMASISIWMDDIRYSERRRILWLSYEAERCSGSIAIYPNDECIYEWRAKDGQSYGSMIMKVDEYKPDTQMCLSLQDIRVALVKDRGEWKIDSETGWHDQMLSLRNSTITEKPLTHRMP